MPDERSAEYKAIVKKLPQLERGELEQLRSAIGALLHLSPADPDVPISDRAFYSSERHDNETWVFGCIADVLSDHGVEYATVGLLRKTAGIAAFRAKLPGLMKFLQHAHKDRRYQRAILCIGIDLLYRDMLEIGLPISSRSVLSQVHRIHAVLNNSFPDYASNGLLGMIVQKEMRRGKADGHKSEAEKS